MAPTQSKLVSNPSSYFFSATRRRERGAPTRLECVAPSPPHRVRGVELTAVRLFSPTVHGLKLSKKALKRRDVPPPVSTEGSSTQRSSTPGPSTRKTPAHSSQLHEAFGPSALQRGSFGESSLSSIASSQSPPSTPTAPRAIIRSRSPEGAAGPSRPSASARLTRAASRGSMKSSGKVFRRASMAAIEKRLDLHGGILTRYGEQDGQPIFIRDRRVTSTIEPDIITYFWESFTAVPLQAPPDLSSYPDLTVGDLYCNHARGDSPTMQLWIWSVAADGSGYWKKAREGDVREDGRRLTITPKRQQPSWVSADWGIKQLRNPKAR
ncbi:hypothetical protein C8Q76DRAFT_789378 [Earliella scabrosa]|nr:hypothetical protein C8Q76DRAFT_789378 [Earliella scabrosa]